MFPHRSEGEGEEGEREKKGTVDEERSYSTFSKREHDQSRSQMSRSYAKSERATLPASPGRPGRSVDYHGLHQLGGAH